MAIRIDTDEPQAAAAAPARIRANGHERRRTVEPRRLLSLTQAVAIIVGIVIGAGIFKAPAMVASFSASAGTMFGAWLLGGVVSVIGALVYAELATTFPSAGGEYHFLRRAYGRSVAFLFAWARLSVITTGSIALLAFVFGDYMQSLLPLGANGSPVYAAMAVIGLTLVNLRGIGAGARTQSWLTVVEVGGLLSIVAAGLWLWLGEPGPGAAAAGTAGGDGAPAGGAVAASAGGAAAFGMAMVFVLLTFGGWNEAGYISAELKDGRRNMLRALLLSLGAITGLYLLVTWAYWQGLGLAGMAASDAIAADLLAVAFGPDAGRLIAVLVAVAALTSINATMIVGARTSFALGRDWSRLARLGEWDAERGTPTVALVVQAIACLLLIGVGRIAGSGFNAMVEFTAPVFWLFFLLCGASLIVLRRREPARERPFAVPFYPLSPLLFCGVCAYMLWSSLRFVSGQAIGGVSAAWIGIAVLAVGCLLLVVLRNTTPPTSATDRSPP